MLCSLIVLVMVVGVLYIQHRSELPCRRRGAVVKTIEMPSVRRVSIKRADGSQAPGIEIDMGGAAQPPDNGYVEPAMTITKL